MFGAAEGKGTTMFANYFKTAWRSLFRNKVYSALNILGLATGMAVALLIGLWVMGQLSYDRFLPGYERAYQVRFNTSDKGGTRTQTEVCIPLADALKKDVPGIAYAEPAMGPVSNSLSVGDKRINRNGMIAGVDFLQIFQFPFVEGNAAQALVDPSSIVLTQSTARALFGDSEALNRTVLSYGNTPLKVTGIIRDLPRNSSFQFGFVTSFNASYSYEGWVKAARYNWNHTFFLMYMGLKPNAKFDEVAARSKMIVQKYAPETYRTFQQQVFFQPLKDWHLFTEFRNGYASGGLIDYVRLFSIIGILVLLIACINFMNLSTAQSEKRAREVGVRKVIGSSRRGLILQFLAESLLITSLSFLLSLLLVQLALPAFNTLTQGHLSIPYSSADFWLVMISYVLLTGLLAGSRPAFYLSSFQPVKVLKGTIKIGRSATLARKALVVLQFTCSTALIISTILIYQQIQYARERPRGYDSNRLVSTPAGGGYHDLKQEALQAGLVSGMTRSLSQPTEIYSHNTIDDWPGHQPNEPLSLAMQAVADPDYFQTLGIKLAMGRNFTGNFAADSTDVILNEAAVKRMRLKQPLNQIIRWSLSNAPNRLRIIGVVQDALTKNPFSAAEPTMFVYQPDWTYNITYRLSPGIATQTSLARLKTIFDKYNPNMPFEYHFVDESYAAHFDLEMLIGRLAAVFAVLAVFISCLGLFGLAAYVAEQRTKEIGIRKVLGASVSQVWLLLSKDFIVLVLLGCVIASPIAFYLLRQWLQGYYYRITIGPGVFIVSALLAIVITVMTVSFQSIRAALANPVKGLRGE